MTPGDVFVLIAFAIAAMKILTGPIGVAIGDRLRGRKEGRRESALAAEVDRLSARLAEAEERLDFTERLLVRSGAGDQIPGGAIR